MLTPTVKVRDFAYTVPNTKGGSTNWANFSVDSAVAIVNALKEAKQTGQVCSWNWFPFTEPFAERPPQLTQELENLIEVGELAIVNLSKILSLHKSELEREIGKAFTVSPGGNPAIRVQLASLLVATRVAGGRKSEQSPSGAVVSPQSSPLSMPTSGTRRNSLHRRSPAGSGYQSLFPGSPSPQSIVPQAQVLAPASHNESMESIFQSANRKLHFTQSEGEDDRRETASIAVNGPKATQTMAPTGEASVTVSTAKQPGQVGSQTHYGSANSSGAPVARPVQSTNCVSGTLTNEEIVRALLKRASLQARTGAWSAPTGREIEEGRISHQGPPPTPYVGTPFTTRLQPATANQNITPTVEELRNAMARAVLLAKQKGIPPPDWEQLMRQEDYFIRQDVKVANNPELHRLTRIQEEDSIDLKETSSPEGNTTHNGPTGETTSNSAEDTVPDPGRGTASAQPEQIGDASNVPVANKAEGQKVLTQAAIIHEANVAGTLEYVRKQESTSASPPTDADLFQCLDAWLASREEASSRAAETGEQQGNESAKEETDFKAFEVNNDGPANTRCASDSEKLNPNKRKNRGESGEIDRSKLASVKRGNFGDAEITKNMEAGAEPRTLMRAPEGFEPLLP
jgi:hypothetical protein